MAPTGESDAVPHPMLTVAAVARRLGVAPSTLRTWDRRYGLGPSAHTAGAHRRYGPTDLARLVVMRRLTSQGVPPSDAARIALTTDVAGEPVASVTSITTRVAGRAEQADDEDVATRTAPPHAGGDRSADGAGDDRSGADLAGDDDSADADIALPDSAHPAPPAVRSIPAARLPEPRFTSFGGSVLPLHGLTAGRSGGGRVVAMPEGTAQARGLARAAMALDTHETMRLLRESVREWGVVQAWDTLVVPVLVGIGDRWRTTGTGVEVEHAFSEAVLGVMRAVSAGLGHPRNEHPLMLACAEGDYHTLPLHVLAAALAERSVSCRLLGVGMPPEALVAAARRCGPAAVFMYARLPVTDPSVLAELPRQRPAPRLVVGGSGWQDVTLPRGVVRVDNLAQAVDELLGATHL